MKDYITAIDSLPLILKIIIAIFVDVIWHIYRIVYALMDRDNTALIVAIILCVIPFSPLIDLIAVIFTGSVWRYKGANA